MPKFFFAFHPLSPSVSLFLHLSFSFPPNFLLRSGLVVIMHADRFKTSRTNAEQNKSCDVGRGGKRGTQRQGVNNGEAERKWDSGERWERLCVEVIHRPEKTGGCYKGKNKKSDSNNPNICALGGRG